MIITVLISVSERINLIWFKVLTARDLNERQIEFLGVVCELFYDVRIHYPTSKSSGLQDREKLGS